jgi:hypothetical protein
MASRISAQKHAADTPALSVRLGLEAVNRFRRLLATVLTWLFPSIVSRHPIDTEAATNHVSQPLSFTAFTSAVRAPVLGDSLPRRRQY